MGDDNRNFFGQLSEVRLSKTIDNITHERLKAKKSHDEIADTFKDAYKDLGYDINIIFSDPKNSPQLLDEKGKPKTGTAYVDDYGVKTIIINAQDSKNATKAGLIGTIVEEGSHVIGKVIRQKLVTEEEKKQLDKLLLKKVNIGLYELVKKNILLGEINNDKDIYKIMTGKEMEKGKNAILEVWKDYIKGDLNINESGEIIISNADETDILTWGLKKAIDSEKKAIVKLIDNSINDKVDKFLRKTEPVISNSVLKGKKNIPLDVYKIVWEKMYVNAYNPDYSIITITPKQDATISVVSTNENGKSFVNEIEGNNPSKVAHETGHFIDSLIEREEFYKKLKDSGIGVIENNQEVYISNHYLNDKNTKEVTFYPLNNR